MQDKGFTQSLIQTKLNRPPLPVDLVPRPRLTNWLDQRRVRPLTLVSAPAGYGKSTLISCWLESVSCPTAWLSLDEHDSELGVFLSYIIAAIETIFPDALPETQAVLSVTPLQPISAIANILINELNQVDQPFILVLDDYHLIKTQTIHHLIAELLLHPPEHLHLVLCTRSDPSFPLTTLRAKSKVTEIRSQDLRFNQGETQQLLTGLIGMPIDRTVVSEIKVQAEGWVTGLRLAVLAIRHRIGQESFPGEISARNNYVTEFLVTEILARQSVSLSDCLLKISILDRFRAGLCEEVCSGGVEIVADGSAGLDFNGLQFLEWMQTSNLFIVPLDNQNEWFRYHQLFRYILQQELCRRFSPEEISGLHAAAGRWYAQNNLIEEALHHLLASGDTTAAIKVVAQHRYRMMNSNRWSRLELWLSLFSQDVIENSAELWILKTWLVYHRGIWSELPTYLEQLSTIIATDPDQETAKRLTGEIRSLRSLIAYHSGDAEGAISQARQALEFTPYKFWSVRLLARSYLGLGLLLTGEKSSGYHAIYDAFQEEQAQNKRFKATLLMTACYFHWISADLESMAQAARQSIAVCPETDYRSIQGYGKYNLGRVHYQRNELAAADDLFSSVVARPYQNYGDCYINSACGLAMTHQAQGKEEKARKVTTATIGFLLETGNTTQLPIALALQAELAIRQGRLPAANQWAEEFEQVPHLGPMIGFIAPHLTLIKVWLAQNTPNSLDRAATLLSQFMDYLTGINHIRLQIEILALQALLDDATGNQSVALNSLEKSLKLAQPGEFIRTFADLGPKLASLLSRLGENRGLSRYIVRIRSAFPEYQPLIGTTGQESCLGSLTNRELQVLELLGKRLTNKEIAAHLVIAPGTVKAHTIRIYQKLAVNDRRQAVEKAVTLGILHPA